MDIVLNRRSVRKFDLNKMIPHEDLVDLIKHGEAAGTARRQKSREYIIIENKDIINELAKIYELTDAVDEWIPTPDCALALENIMVYAVSKGIGTVMLGTYPNKDRFAAANKLLKLTEDKFVFTFICLGYPIDKDNAFYDMNKFDEKVISYIK